MTYHISESFLSSFGLNKSKFGAIFFQLQMTRLSSDDRLDLLQDSKKDKELTSLIMDMDAKHGKSFYYMLHLLTNAISNPGTLGPHVLSSKICVLS